MLPPLLEVEGDGWVIGESGEAAFGGNENDFVSFTDSEQLFPFLRRQPFEVDNVEVRVVNLSNRDIMMKRSPSHEILFRQVTLKARVGVEVEAGIVGFKWEPP
jgi:hypothetical protein